MRITSLALINKSAKFFYAQFSFLPVVVSFLKMFHVNVEMGFIKLVGFIMCIVLVAGDKKVRDFWIPLEAFG